MAARITSFATKRTRRQRFNLKRPEHPLVVIQFYFDQQVFKEFARDHNIIINDLEFEEVQTS